MTAGPPAPAIAETQAVNTKPVHYRQNDGWTPCNLQPRMRARRTRSARAVTCPTCLAALAGAERPTCQWFALCSNPATVGVRHPILGVVPACKRCTNRAPGHPDLFGPLVFRDGEWFVDTG